MLSSVHTWHAPHRQKELRYFQIEFIQADLVHLLNISMLIYIFWCNYKQYLPSNQQTVQVQQEFMNKCHGFHGDTSVSVSNKPHLDSNMPQKQNSKKYTLVSFRLFYITALILSPGPRPLLKITHEQCIFYDSQAVYSHFQGSFLQEKE